MRNITVPETTSVVYSGSQYYEEVVTIVKIENIPYGHANAVQRPANPVEDRILRGKIEKANRSDDCIINVGHGYYRPVPGDATDESELN